MKPEEAREIVRELKELADRDESSIADLRKADRLEQRARAGRDELRLAIDAIGRVGPHEATQEPGMGGSGGRGIFAAIKASGFDVKERPSVSFPASLILRKDSSFPVDTTEELPRVVGPFRSLTFDQRYVYPAFPSANLGDNLAVSEYTETAAPTVSGSVERDPLDTSAKATLDVAFDYVAEKSRQVAVTMVNIPQQVVASYPAFQSLLNTRMQVQLDEAIDVHVLNQIDGAFPDSGADGVDPIEILRNSVAIMRAKGVSPTIAALNPADSAVLDLSQASGTGEYLFAVRSTGDSSPLWGLSLRECKNVPVGSAYLIDPQVTGVLYAGPTQFLSDPYTGMTTNVVAFRLEANVLFHVRNADGVYIADLGTGS